MEAYRRAAVWDSSAASVPPDALLEPSGLTVDPFDGRVFVADTGNNRVQVYEADGQYVRTIGGPGDAPEGLAQPRDVAVQGSLVFVTDAGHARVALFTVDGGYVGEWPGLASPWGIAASLDGRVFVVESAAGRIAIFRANGDPVARWAFGATGYRGLDVTPDGRVVLADAGTQQVRVLDDQGNEMNASAPLGAAPDDVAVGPGGFIYATVGSANLLRLQDGLGLPESRRWPIAGVVGVAATTDAVYATYQDDLRPRHGVQRWSGAPLTADIGWGGVPAPLGVFTEPRRIAGGDPALIVDGWRRVQRFDASGTPVDQVPVGDANDISPGPGGDILVARDDQIARIDLAGDAVWTWTTPPSATEYAWIVALDYDASSGQITALDIGRQRAWVLDADGQLIGQPSFQPGAGATTALWDMARSNEGFFTVNRRADTVEGRDHTLRTVLRSTPIPGGAYRVASDAAGNAYVLNRRGWVWKYAPAGDLLAVWRVGDPADDRSQPVDLTIDSSGRVLVVDRGLQRVEAWAIDPKGTPGPVPSFDPTCAAQGDKTADPTKLALGDETTITLTVGGACPPVDIGADVVLVLDVSGSMAAPATGFAGTKLDAAKAAAITFVDLLDLGQFRVGVVAFNQTAQLVAPLSDVINVRGPIQGLAASGGTDIAAGVDEARLELTGPRRRLDTAGVIVLLTDGFSDPVMAQRAADQAKLEGLRLFTIGFGDTTAEDLLRNMASSPDDFYLAPTAAELEQIYSEIAARIRASVLFTSLTVVDELPDNMVYVDGSGVPPPVVTGQTLTWQLSDVPFSGMSLSYRVLPQEVGIWPTNTFAVGEGTDGLGYPGRIVFPVPQVEVSAPTGTPPPPTITPTPGPTATPAPAYLPALRKETCVRRQQHVDVVLVIDSSDSMLALTAGGQRTKLAAAVEAAGSFLDLLALQPEPTGQDGAALVAFNSDALIVTPLTHDRNALASGLAAIPQGPGTRIDLGLSRAAEALAGSARNPANTAVAVLLTDGRPSLTTPEAVVAAAADLRSQGTLLYAIGLGPDVDPDLLAAITAAPARVLLTPDAEQLAEIYQQIARELPCVVP